MPFSSCFLRESPSPRRHLLHLPQDPHEVGVELELNMGVMAGSTADAFAEWWEEQLVPVPTIAPPPPL